MKLNILKFYDCLTLVDIFSVGQLPALRKITFAKVICNNFKIDKLQPNVFRVPGT